MSEATSVTPDPKSCDDGTLLGNHNWVDEYYGTKCTKCGTFYPHGCAPWDDDVRDGFDFGDDTDEEDESEWQESDYWDDDGPTEYLL